MWSALFPCLFSRKAIPADPFVLRGRRLKSCAKCRITMLRAPCWWWGGGGEFDLYLSSQTVNHAPNTVLDKDKYLLLQTYPLLTNSSTPQDVKEVSFSRAVRFIYVVNISDTLWAHGLVGWGVGVDLISCSVSGLAPVWHQFFSFDSPRKSTDYLYILYIFSSLGK